MTEMTRMHPLDTAEQIGFVGDIHGDLGALLAASAFMAARDVHVLIGLGDLGILWPGRNGPADIAKISHRLAGKDQTFYWLDGNHEDFRRLAQFPIDDDGLRRLAPNVIHMPRGYRTLLHSGKSMAVLGGANSIDRGHRNTLTWWPEESIIDDDLTALGNEHTDILIGHDAPLDIISLDKSLATTNRYWSADALEYARRGREMFHTGFLQTSPKLYLGGHYHQPIDEIVGYFADGHGFACRVVLLDMVQNRQSSAAAILDVNTFDLSFFTVRGEPRPANESQVTELTEKMSGRWMLHTLRSRHRIDLDQRTIERIPGEYSRRIETSDQVHRLRTLDVCRIGEPGRWTMNGDRIEVDFFWHVSSVIRHIQPLPPAPGG